jgi:hypothetical protein
MLKWELKNYELLISFFTCIEEVIINDYIVIL